jgi:hypothetical protein
MSLYLPDFREAKSPKHPAFVLGLLVNIGAVMRRADHESHIEHRREKIVQTKRY